MSKQKSPNGGQREAQNNSDRRPRRRLRPWRVLLVLLVFALLLTGGAGVGVMAGILRDLPAVDDLNYLQSPESSFLYDINGELITEIHGAEDRESLDINEIPEHVRNAFLAIEDHRFYQHFGIDLGGIIRALWNNLRGGHTQGASTITQQLARTIFPIGRKVTITRKLQEVVLALQLERRYTKDEILSMYLNQIFLGHNAYGIQAASRRFFDKDIQEVTIAEAALLASIPKAPSNFSPYTNLERLLARRDLVINRMEELEMITPEEARAARAEEPVIAELKSGSNIPYPSFVNHVIDELQRHFTRFYMQEGEDEAQARQLAGNMIYGGGLRIETTLDPAIQSFAEEKVRETLEENFPRPALAEGQDPASNRDYSDPVQAAVVVLDTTNGAIRAIVGDYRTGEGVQRGFNLATHGTRQPGSAFKPLIAYGPAIEYGWTAATIVDDSPTSFKVPGQPDYRPRNYGTAAGSSGSYRGLMTLRDAVRESKNVPAVQTLHAIGVDRGVEFAQRLGITTLVTQGSRHDKVLSAALGGLTHGVTVIDMATAFAVFGNQGVRSEAHAIRKVSDRHGRVWLEKHPHQEAVIEPDVAYIMTDVLRNVLGPHRIGSGGTAGRWSLPGGRPAAGKTGTTNDWTDAWFVGYTPQLTTAVWIGHAEQQRTLRDRRGALVTGGSHPAATWHAIMAHAHQNLPVVDFSQPNNIVRAPICAKTGTLPGPHCPPAYRYTEVFIQGTEPTAVENAFQPFLVCSTDDGDVLYTPGCDCEPVEKVFMTGGGATQEGDEDDEAGEEEDKGPALPIDKALSPPTATCTPRFGLGGGQSVAGRATITARNNSFTPKRVTGFQEGKTYRLVVASPEGPRTFVLPELDIEMPIMAGETVQVAFTPPRAGNFSFYFRHDGRQSEQGTLVVEEASGTPEPGESGNLGDRENSGVGENGDGPAANGGTPADNGNGPLGAGAEDDD